MSPELWLVRHGATEWTATGQHTGRTDVSLTADGRREAAALFRPLDRQKFAAVFMSPLGRARETARIAGFADAVVIGSRLIQEMEASTPETAVEKVRVLLKNIRETMDS